MLTVIQSVQIVLSVQHAFFHNKFSLYIYGMHVDKQHSPHCLFVKPEL